VSSDPTGVGATAYLVNASRARQPTISGDPWAAAWIEPGLEDRVEALWQDYARAVSPHDDLLVSYRHRFFLTALREMQARTPRFTLVSLGVGFTSYPFLLDAGVRAIEIDRTDIIEQRQARLAALADVLPPRTVELVRCDLADAAQRSALLERLGPDLANGPSFVLVEGLSYYLPRDALDALFSTFRTHQRPGSRLGLDAWPTSIVHDPAFQRQEAYFRDVYAMPHPAYTLLDPEDVGGIEGYRILQHTAAPEMEAADGGTRLAGTAEALDEQLYLLERTPSS